MNKQREEELPGMPELNDLAKAATQYLNMRDKQRMAQDNLDSSKKLLAIEFQKAGKKTIRVSGYILNYLHKESESIQVKEG